MNVKLGTGAYRSKKDKRDIKDPHLSLATPYSLSYATDFPGFTGSDISLLDSRYQKKLGVCVAAAIVTIVEYLHWKKTGIYTKLSVAFLYQVIKKYIDGNRTEGTSPRSGLKAAVKYGICKEETMPTDYDLSHDQFIDQKIPDNAWTEALEYAPGGYLSIPVERSLLAAAISKYGMVLARYECGDTWWIPSWFPKDIFPLKKPSVVVSGHLVANHSYDFLKDIKAWFSFLNWWSGAWGNRGRGEHFLDDYAPTEVWAITLESTMPYKESTPSVPDSIWRSLLEILRKVVWN